MSNVPCFALIGDPVQHSLSPVLHRWLLDQLGLPHQYGAVRVTREDLPRFVAHLRSGHYSGVNVTIPHKESLVSLLDEVDREAQTIGAVNTVRHQRGRLSGFNTDGTGFLTALRANGISTTGADVVMLGAGGSARAVAMALAGAGVGHIAIYNRSLDRGLTLQRSVGALVGIPIQVYAFALDDLRQMRQDLARATLLVNATSLGMWPQVNNSPLPIPDALHKKLVVFDLVYNPWQTALLREARLRGLRGYNGIDMLIYQALGSLRIWLGEDVIGVNGRDFDLAALRSALADALRIRS